MRTVTDDWGSEVRIVDWLDVNHESGAWTAHSRVDRSFAWGPQFVDLKGHRKECVLPDVLFRLCKCPKPKGQW